MKDNKYKKFDKMFGILQYHCAITPDEYKAYGFEYRTEDGRKFFFCDNRQDILAVAHVDTVLPEDICEYNKKSRTIHSGVLDDRLGAFILSEYLMGELDYDLLLTIDEEKHRSTAKFFNPKGKKYKWVFSFDRAGNDVVVYDYESPEMVKLLEHYGYEVNQGSYSDICELEHLGCKAFNFGTGYRKAHTKDCFAKVDDIINNVERFKRFYEDNKDSHFPHIPARLVKPGKAKGTQRTYILTD